MSIKKTFAYTEEATKPFGTREAMEEASRCLLCHDAPCSKACPAGTDPASFIMSIRFRNVKGAAETIRSANALGGICGRVCPYDRLCEQACSRCGIDKPIQIGRLQSFATDQEKLFGMKILEAPEKKAAKVACVGAGPASLACAAELAKAGAEVAIFEKKAKAGGMMRYGIIPSRLPNGIVEQEIAHIEELGVKIVTNTEIGKDLSFEDLKAQGYEAFFIGTGLDQSKELDIPGVELAGVESALDFLERAKTADGKIDLGKDVIVIGGGDVAMDAASTAALLGSKVTVVYRRTLAEAPANTKEVEFAQSLGVGFCFQFKPETILGENNKVTAFQAIGTDGVSKLLLKADAVILAIGQTASPAKFAGEARTEKNLISAENGATSIPGVFAGGDIVNGGMTVVQAVAEGKSAARSIQQYLGGKK